MSWKPSGEPKWIGPGTVQYLRSAHTHEGAFEAAIGERTVRVLPDGVKSGHDRSRSLGEALRSLPELPFTDLDPVAYVVGRLIVDGFRSIELDGEPLLATPAARGEWRVMLLDDGRLEATFLGSG